MINNEQIEFMRKVARVHRRRVRAKNKSTSGPTVTESRRREKGQVKLLLRLDADDLELLDAKRRAGESRQAAIRRMIRK